MTHKSVEKGPARQSSAAQRQAKASTMADNRPGTEQIRQLKVDIGQSNSTQEAAGRIAQINQSPKAVAQRQPNNTGLPDNLKSGMENLSGMSLDHVKVHYNSAKPAAVQAHAYAQGSDIHLASGQEQHLPHELGHVVQQAQGRVKPTTDVGGVAVNDDASLESEATKMGETALKRG